VRVDLQVRLGEKVSSESEDRPQEEVGLGDHETVLEPESWRAVSWRCKTRSGMVIAGWGIGWTLRTRRDGDYVRAPDLMLPSPQYI
jgi:hypothetical protein